VISEGNPYLPPPLLEQRLRDSHTCGFAEEEEEEEKTMRIQKNEKVSTTEPVISYFLL
jgi:hypothetical protein